MSAMVPLRSSLKSAEKDLLIWLDQSIDDKKQDCRNTISRLQCIVNIIGTFTDSDQCIQFIKAIKNEKIFMIMSGSLGEKTVAKIHDMLQVNSIFIFCGDKARHEVWAKSWSKINGVFTQIAPMCESLQQAKAQNERNAISVRFMATGSDTYDKNLDQLHCSFMYTQILKEILLSIKFKQGHIQEFITYCREIHADNNKELNNIKNFEENYSDKTSIWWYTYECFLYPMLNRALRTMDVDSIISMGFFIDDLHHQIQSLHSQQFNNHPTDTNFIVYRGQGLSMTDFDQMKATKGGLMSFNNFLSTSRDRDVSLEFARQALHNPNMIGVLFIMTINPSVSTAPFASITDVSYFKREEDEVLFSMHTIFRTRNIKPIADHDRLFQVELTLTSDDDKDLRLLTDHTREATKGRTGWDRLHALLVKLGQPEKAQRVYDIMSGRTTNNLERRRPAGSTVPDQKKTTDDKNGLPVLKRSLSVSHSELIDTCNKFGETYYNVREYSKAISYYEQALKIQQESLPSNHPDFGITYNNIGNVYNQKSECSKALLYYEQALKIQQQSLPLNHPALGMSYNNIGVVYKKMNDYSNAFSFFKRAVDIGQHSLLPNDPNLKKWRKNFESVQKNADMYVIV